MKNRPTYSMLGAITKQLESDSSTLDDRELVGNLKSLIKKIDPEEKEFKLVKK